jgi:tetratricopeptide (TPR) repeat protein
LGLIEVALGNNSEASEFLTMALESWKRQNHMLNVGLVKSYLGLLEFHRGNLEDARSHFDAATIIFSDLGDDFHVGLCSYEFGRQEMAARNFPNALDLLQKAEKSYLMVNLNLDAAQCVEQIGRIRYYQKQHSAAKAHLTKAKEEFDMAGSVEDLIPNSYYLAWVEFREGNNQEAKQILKEARQWFAEEDGYWQAMYARSLGEFAFHEGDKESAAMFFAQAQGGFEAIDLTSQNMDKDEENSEGWRWFVEADTDGSDRVEVGYDLLFAASGSM